MVYVIVAIEVKEGMMEDFLEILKVNVALAFAKGGCIFCVPVMDFYSDIASSKNRVTLIECWENIECFKANSASPEMEEYNKATAHMVVNKTANIMKAV